MSAPIRKPVDPAAAPIPAEAPRAPTEAEWAAMSPAQRQQAIAALVDSMSQEEIDERLAMAEGDPHFDAKVEARDTLRAWFGRRGRRVYVGADMKAHYPGEKGFTPDVIAVTDVDPSPRLCWMVSAEGKGIDLAIEVHYAGNWRKDFVDNVARYATLGIREYFIYDIPRGHLKAHRLPPTGVRRYESIPSRAGRYRSEVLDLDLAVEAGRLRFYADTAELVTASELVGKLEGMIEAAEARIEQEQARAEQEQARAEQAVGQLSAAILMLLDARGVPASEEARGRILGETDVDVLGRWLQRAATAAAVEELFLESTGR
ncbi:Uma2 family endonuclease [Sorangium sp. So ce363]|uniref:Uma2 family endonuclease n=1 Tax=Sorangium sp. So ce363 TaxID=3133304 RepID=UPI003F5E507A